VDGFNGERTVSISSTVLKAFSDRPAIGAKKLPAAPEHNIVSSSGI
jgi:hypothetical protein